MVFSDERIVGDDFAAQQRELSADLLADLKHINTLTGEVRVTEDYRTLVNQWRALGEPPVPTHPKLIHYATRRRAHLYKLSIISAIDRSDLLLLTRDDFNRAMNWLAEAEAYMPDLFKAGAAGSDAKAMDEIYHFVMVSGKTPEHKLLNFARERVPAHSVMRVLDIMERSAMIKVSHTDKAGARVWEAVIRG
jgi:hypothetical protein